MRFPYPLSKSAVRAFTLMELLVVIAILGVIIALLFPVFAHSREVSRRNACLNKLHQVSGAILQYTQDYDGLYPSSARGDILNGQLVQVGVGWAEAIQPYLRNPQILQCPSEPLPANLHGGLTMGYTDYWFNVFLTGAAEAELTYTTSTVMNGDGDGAAGKSDYYLMGVDINQNYAHRHLRGSNYSFADGHIRWLTPEQVLSGDYTCMPQNVPNGSNATFCIKTR